MYLVNKMIERQDLSLAEFIMCVPLRCSVEHENGLKQVTDSH